MEEMEALSVGVPGVLRPRATLVVLPALSVAAGRHGQRRIMVLILIGDKFTLDANGLFTPIGRRSGRYSFRLGLGRLGGPMAAEDADLEIGLHWDPAQNGFDVNLRFENIASGTDEWKHSDDPLVIDLDRLGQLVHDEAAYAAALTEMVLRPQDVGDFTPAP